MKNSAYWKMRFEQLEAASNKNAVESFATIEEQYMAAQKAIEQQISTWYTRFAKNNNISMAEARQLLTTKELAEFRWDVKDYIKYGEQNALDTAWMQQLENASARFHVSRLEALKLQTQQTVEKLFGGQTDAIDHLLKKNYLDTYYHTAYEIQKGFSVGWDIASIDDSALEKLISKLWATDKRNFSERIWSNKTSLINEVHTQLSQTIMLGKSPDDAIKTIAKKMGVSKNQAGRLVMTESAYFNSQSQKDAFNELDVEHFEIVATLDSHTSEICQQMDGQVFPMKDYEPGVTAPPFHPWCRSTTAPYFDDNFTERAAKDADGKTYYVDSKLKYPEWKKTFKEGGSKDGLTKIEKDDTIKSNQYPVDYNCEIAQKFGTSHYDDMHQMVVDCSDSNAAKVWQKYESQIQVGDAAYTSGTEHCSGSQIYVNGAVDAKGSTWSAPYQTSFHESGHAIDNIACGKINNPIYGVRHFSSAYNGGVFPQTIKQEIDDMVSALDNQMKADFKVHEKDYSWLYSKGFISDSNWQFYQRYGRWLSKPVYSKSIAYKALEKQIDADIAKGIARADLSDIIDGATLHKINLGFGHSGDYWSKRTYNGLADGLAAEAFAEMFDSTMSAPTSLDAIKKYLPKSYGVFCDMLKEMLK
ncbi:MAG: minor capsid protein [Oscillospiraceae bacterium]|nr:minor capsid protein [Oscillospiraceae bacterium]